MPPRHDCPPTSFETSQRVQGCATPCFPCAVRLLGVAAVVSAIMTVGCVGEAPPPGLAGTLDAAEGDPAASDPEGPDEVQADPMEPRESRTGTVSLLRRQWLETGVVPVTYTRVSRAGDPVIAVVQARSGLDVETFAVPFDGELTEASGIHTFGPLASGEYRVQLVFSGDDIVDELAFAVLEDSDADGTPDVDDDCPFDGSKLSAGVCGCDVEEVDTDDDGVPDCIDECDDDAAPEQDGGCGCADLDTDADGDGVPDCADECPTDPVKQAVGVCGCGVPDTDTDGDGTLDCQDLCAQDDSKTEPGECGCGVAEGSCTPPCPGELLPGVRVGRQSEPVLCSSNGEYTFGLNLDGELAVQRGQDVVWVADAVAPADRFRLQNDGNIVARAEDGAAVWSSKTAGVGAAVLTIEDDGALSLRVGAALVWAEGPFENGDLLCRQAGEGAAVDLSCPDGLAVAGIVFASYGTPGGSCGSYVQDACHEAASQVTVESLCVGRGRCSVEASELTFGVPCEGIKRLSLSYTCAADACPDDASKGAPGVCGCGTPDDDGDGDGAPDCEDLCPGDPNKSEPGTCGCGVDDIDSDGDASPDCQDPCPTDPNKTAPGECGCGVAEGTCS